MEIGMKISKILANICAKIIKIKDGVFFCYFKKKSMLEKIQYLPHSHKMYIMGVVELLMSFKMTNK